MKVVTFHITAVQPLLLTSLQGDPNSSVSFPYIPGSVIRGVLIGQRRQQRGKDLDLADAETRRLFFDGKTRYLNAYPLHDKRRPLPIPRSLVALKRSDWDSNRQLTVYDRSVEPPPPDEALRSLEGFVSRGAGTTLRYSAVARVMHIHNQRDRPMGRGTKLQGALFRYEAIAPGQVFVAAVLYEHDGDSQVIRDLLPDRVWLGGSRSAGYGEATIGQVKILDDWYEAGTPPKERVARAAPPAEDSDDDLAPPAPLPDPLRLTLTLASDMLLRDDGGQPTTAPPLAAIGRALGCTVTLDEEHSALATTLHGGFNRTWGLPLPQASALAAGSTLVLRLDAVPDVDGLARLEAEGLGERRAEGFGRVVCNWLPSSAEQTLCDEKDVPAAAPAAPEHGALAALIARRVLMQRMEQELIALTKQYSISGDISNTQLSRLRIIARRALGAASMQPVHDFLEHLPSNAREQFERAYAGNQRLRTWLDGCVGAPRGPWAKVRDVTVAEQTAQVSDALATEYTLRLIMAVARLKVKEAADA